MAYDSELANRIRTAVQDEPGLSEKRMFGGLAFLVNGNMAVCASSEGGLLLRVDSTRMDSMAGVEGVSRHDTWPQVNGWLHVDAAVLRTGDDLRRWVNHGLICARSLEPK